ncbi:MAG: response regulator [Anaerolineae bacterium]|nr:response regulator [Anaerolineae bacterium]
MYRRVLLVDDEPILLKSLRPFLEDAGHQVLTATEAGSAFQLLESDRPDAIVCDVGLPGMDGLEFFAKVRQNPQWRGIPFIFLTGGKSTPGSSTSRQPSGGRVLRKPFDVDDLLMLLRCNAGGEADA